MQAYTSGSRLWIFCVCIYTTSRRTNVATTAWNLHHMIIINTKWIHLTHTPNFWPSWIERTCTFPSSYSFPKSAKEQFQPWSKIIPMDHKKIVGAPPPCIHPIEIIKKTWTSLAPSRKQKEKKSVMWQSHPLWLLHIHHAQPPPETVCCSNGIICPSPCCPPWEAPTCRLAAAHLATSARTRSSATAAMSSWSSPVPAPGSYLKCCIYTFPKPLLGDYKAPWINQMPFPFFATIASQEPTCHYEWGQRVKRFSYSVLWLAVSL